MSGPCWNPPIPSSTTCWDGPGATCDEEPPAPIPCPECPTSGPAPIALKTWTVAKLQNTLVGNTGNNQCDMLVKVKNALVATGKWSVISSSNGTTVSASDLWTDWTKLKGFPFGVLSWIVLKNPALGCEIMIATGTTIGWTEITLYFSATGVFTGGTNTVAPTAIDQATWGGNSWLGRSGTTLQFYALAWVASDGTGTRVGFFYAGKCVAWWQVDALYIAGSQNTTGWATPYFTAATHNVLFDANAPPSRLTSDTFWFSGSGGNDFTKTVTIPGTGPVTAYGTRETVQNASNNAFSVPIPGAALNPWAHRYLWTSPMGIYAVNSGSPTLGFCGYIQDQWWTSSNFNDGDTIDSGRLVIVGESIMPWDGTLAPPVGAGVASVDYPKTSFFGRTTL